MESYLAIIAAVAATVFTLDLVRDLAKRRRPHVVAYAIGIGMFAAATWALALGLMLGWSGPIYRTFFLFGAVLNIPFLALGSMYLVVGKRAGEGFVELKERGSGERRDVPVADLAAALRESLAGS